MRSGEASDLTLYKFDACPYCRIVMRRIDDLGLEVAYRDTRSDPRARQELMAIGGKTQVPCLLIDGQPLYESWDIIQFLNRYAHDRAS